jgi:hypothetical protein
MSIVETSPPSLLVDTIVDQICLRISSEACTFRKRLIISSVNTQYKVQSKIVDFLALWYQEEVYYLLKTKQDMSQIYLGNWKVINP